MLSYYRHVMENIAKTARGIISALPAQAGHVPTSKKCLVCLYPLLYGQNKHRRV